MEKQPIELTSRGQPLESGTHNDFLFSNVQFLIETVQKLSLARSHEEIRNIVKHAARKLVHSDGTTFVLRDQDQCYYVDEEAIAPLWKGQRFPMSACISGWVMLNKEPAIIPDIYKDPRIPIDAYRPTFVKSLLMIPIRTLDPIGAIGNYWQSHHEPTSHEIELLSALADSTSIAIENVNLYLDLENRVKDRTHQLEIANHELEAFSYSVSHDLHAPLRAIEGFSKILLNKYINSLPDDGQEYLNLVVYNTDKMSALIADLLRLSRISRTNLNYEEVNISELSDKILQELARTYISVTWEIEKDIIINADKSLLEILLENLLSNACKFSRKVLHPKIEIRQEKHDKETLIVITDNGAGFHSRDGRDLFQPFLRLHREDEFPGTGIGLAIAHRIMAHHKGEIWGESRPNKGAKFYLSFKSDVFS